MPHQPNPLQKGDKVAIFCPASPIDRERVIEASELLNNWGLQVEIGQTVGAEYYDFAGSDQQRADEFQEFLDDEEIKAIFCARGGYGSSRMIDMVSFENFKTEPKWIIGYSDVTTIHNHIQQVFNIETIHAVMPSEYNSCLLESTNSLQAILFGRPIRYQFFSNELNKKGKASGKLLGGNLSIVHSMLGSKSQINTKGAILFIEDVGEKLYNIDRMMVSLKRAGLLHDLAGLLVGGFTGSKGYEDFGKTAYEIIDEHCSPFNYPIAYGFPAGHQDDNRALIFGREVTLSVGTPCYLDMRK